MPRSDGYFLELSGYVSLKVPADDSFRDKNYGNLYF